MRIYATELFFEMNKKLSNIHRHFIQHTRCSFFSRKFQFNILLFKYFITLQQGLYTHTHHARNIYDVTIRDSRQTVIIIINA